MKLKPCPFCGEVPKLESADDNSAARVVCRNPFCRMSAVMTLISIPHGEPAERWNTRFPDPLLTEALDALRELVAFIEGEAPTLAEENINVITAHEVLAKAKETP